MALQLDIISDTATAYYADAQGIEEVVLECGDDDIHMFYELVRKVAFESGDPRMLRDHIASICAQHAAREVQRQQAAWGEY